MAVAHVDIQNEERPHEEEEENSKENGENKVVIDDVSGKKTSGNEKDDPHNEGGYSVSTSTSPTAGTNTATAPNAAAEVLLEQLRKDREVSEAALVELQRELADLNSSSPR